MSESRFNGMVVISRIRMKKNISTRLVLLRDLGEMDIKTL